MDGISKKTIYVVDDDPMNLQVVELALSKRFNVMKMSSAMKLFSSLEMQEKLPDLILLDIVMPDIDGFATAQILKAHEGWKNVPIIFVTSHEDPETEAKGFGLGADDFIAKPYSIEILNKRVDVIINLNTIISNQISKILRVQNSIINVITSLIENRDQNTGYHITRTSKYLEMFIKKMKEMRVYYDEILHWDVDKLVSAARLHDLGKISISDVILNKPARLDKHEFEIIKTHTTKGVKILEEIIQETGEDDFLKNAKLFAGTHHEKWNGNGYPNALIGESIPLQGRILTILDVYDALVSVRPYKEVVSHDKAVLIILEDNEIHFDPTLIRVFKELEPELQIVSHELLKDIEE
jgi:putative two-component system response regulator